MSNRSLILELSEYQPKIPTPATPIELKGYVKVIDQNGAIVKISEISVEKDETNDLEDLVLITVRVLLPS